MPPPCPTQPIPHRHGGGSSRISISSSATKPSNPDKNDESSSRSISETINGSHLFTIHGYSLAKGMGAGKFIQSDTFTVGGYDWAIYFYPDGKNPEDSSAYVSVFIALVTEGATDVRALFELTLVDQSNGGKDKVHSHFDRALESGPYTLRLQGSMWGYKRFFRRAALETSEFLKDDSLVLKCTVGVVRTRLECPKHYAITVPPSDMGASLRAFLESGVGCDLVFQVGDEEFKAHKLILAACSPVFKAQFFGHLGDASVEKVVIKDVEPFIFKAMLMFIYEDKLPDIHEVTGSSSFCTFTVMVQHLLAAADMYNLDRLKLLCESKLCEKITTETVATTLALAEQHHCPQLKAVCLKFAADSTNLGAVMQSDGYKHLEESCPSVLQELLLTFASVDANENTSSSKKRSSSSINGLDLPIDGNVAVGESVNPNGRRLRPRRH